MTGIGLTGGPQRRAITPSATGLFFSFAAILTAVAGVSLLTPGGPLDVMWTIKPHEHETLLGMGPAVGFGFCGLSALMAAAGIGCFARFRWGWRLALAIFVVNGLADAARIPFGGLLEGAFGLAVAALIAWWLTRPRVRELFQ